MKPGMERQRGHKPKGSQVAACAAGELWVSRGASKGIKQTEIRESGKKQRELEHMYTQTRGAEEGREQHTPPAIPFRPPI